MHLTNDQRIDVFDGQMYNEASNAQAALRLIGGCGCELAFGLLAMSIVRRMCSVRFGPARSLRIQF